jgi:hypothetical protein
MAQVKQQGIHSKGDSGRVVGMDQVTDAEGQDCGQNGHKGPTRNRLSSVPTEAPTTEPATRA